MENIQKNIDCQPKLFDLSNENDRVYFLNFCENNKNINFIDSLGEQMQELFLVNNPNQISHANINSVLKIDTKEDDGIWVYFSWKNTAVRILKADEYNKLRLSRNKNLILNGEETILKTKNIAIAGLNVGNPGAVCLALEGIGSTFKLADFDPLSVSNLNRFRAGLTDLNINKAIISARQMYEINPYLNIEIYEDGLNIENCSNFIDKPRIDLLIEEMDNLKLKISIRNFAKKSRVPVIMVTGNAENVLIDVERYDIDENLEILAGFLPNDIISKIESIKPGEGTYRERINLARDFMDSKYLDPRLLASFDEVGKTLAGIPQLAESSFLRGAVLCHFTKHILLGHNIPSGRYSISLSGVKFNKYD